MQLIPKPQSFLHFMTLQTGVELICIMTVFNKASGIYGLLALITGAQISGAQMSMYLYSIAAAVLCAYSLRHVKRGSSSVLQVLGFAYFTLFDTLINFAYTALFATSWFMVLSQNPTTSTGAGGVTGGASGAMDANAGVSSPSHTVSSTIVTPTMVNGVPSTKVVGSPSSTVPGLGDGVLHPEQIPSIIALVGILLVKVYFILVVLSYARSLVAEAESSSMARYTGWQARLYDALTKGSYWSRGEDLRLSKSRSSRRSEEQRR